MESEWKLICNDILDRHQFVEDMDEKIALFLHDFAHYGPSESVWREGWEYVVERLGERGGENNGGES